MIPKFVVCRSLKLLKFYSSEPFKRQSHKMVKHTHTHPHKNTRNKTSFLLKLQPRTLLKKYPECHGFLCELCNVFKSTFLVEHVRGTAFVEHENQKSSTF